MRMRTAFGATVVALAIVSAASRDRLVVASAQHEHEHQTSASAPEPQRDAMMKMHEEMMAAMQADEAKLDALVKDMNAARGEERTVAMTAVLNELVRQQKGMRAHMGEMHQMMDGRAMKPGR